MSFDRVAEEPRSPTPQKRRYTRVQADNANPKAAMALHTVWHKACVPHSYSAQTKFLTLKVGLRAGGVGLPRLLRRFHTHAHVRVDAAVGMLPSAGGASSARPL